MSRALLALLLVAVFTIQTLALANELPRHLDPATLPEENPDPERLFRLYYMIFHEAAVENFTGAEMWLGWAVKVKALPNLSPSLGEYANLTEAEIGLLVDVRSRIDAIRMMLKRLDPDALSAVKEALRVLDKANSTLNSIDLLSGSLGSILKYPTAQLDEGVEELKALIRFYYKMLWIHRAEAIVDLDRPYLYICVEEDSVLVGSIFLVRGLLSESESRPMEGRFIQLFFEDEVVAYATTVENGGVKMEFIVPYVYDSNATIYAEYVPTGEDVGVWGRTVSNILVVDLIWYQPELVVEVPKEAYPGMNLLMSGRLRYGQMGLPGVLMHISTFKSVVSVRTSVDGVFTASMHVLDDYPEGEKLVGFRSDAAGLYAPAVAEEVTLVVRFPCSLLVSGPDWIFSGAKLSVVGRVVSVAAVEGSRVELRSMVGSSSTNVGVDGGFDAEVDIPFTLFTSTYDYQVFSKPAPWIRPSVASGKVFVINPLTLLSIPVLLGGLAYLVSKKIHLAPSKPRVVSESVIHPIMVESVAGDSMEPQGMRGIFNWAVSVVQERIGLTIGRSQTIREWLSSLRGRVDGPVYDLLTKLSLMYERWLYRTPVDGDDAEARDLFTRIKELFL